LLSQDELNKIKYVNLHAHCHYSLQDGVGSVKDHFIRTMEAGHCGCAMTDHGSYASSLELFLLEENKLGDKKVAKAFKEHGKTSHPTVKGSELYIFDDRYKIQIDNLAKDNTDSKALITLIKRLENNPRFSGLFNKQVKITDIEVVETKKETKKKGPGTLVLEALKNKTLFNEDALSAEGKVLVLALGVATTKSRGYKYNHITVIAKNELGHKNLSTLATMATTPDNFYSKPRIPLSLLVSHKDGLIVTSGCFVGMIPQAIYRDSDEAEEYVEFFKTHFGDDFYLEMHLAAITHDWDGKTQQFVPLGSNLHEKVNIGLYALAKKFDLTKKIYITQDSHYPNKEDKIRQDLMILSDRNNKNGWHFYDGYPVMSVTEMYDKFQANYSHLFSDEEFVQWCETSLEVIEKTRDFTINTDLKMMEVEYSEHPLENPISLKNEFFNKLAITLGLDLENQKTEVYTLKSQLRLALIRKKGEIINKTLEIDYAPLDKLLKDSAWVTSVIDKEETHKNKAVIDKLEKTLNSWEEVYKDEEMLTKTLRLSKDERFPGLSKGLRIALRVSLHNEKIDLTKKEYRDRLFFEIDTIQFNGMTSFIDYFMTFEELVRFILEMEELKGPGRGSAAGCLLSYALDITDVDPIKRNLPFWRFLLKERIGLLYPYIDGYEVSENDYRLKAMKKGFAWTDSIFNKLWDLIPKESMSNELKKELIFLRTNPDIACYLYGLSQDGTKVDTNSFNTHVGHLLGICPGPKAKVSESPRGVPDIDYDSSCRDLLVDYLVKSRGKDKVALIGTYGSLKVKSAMKTVFRVKSKLSVPEQNKITALFDRVRFTEEDMSKGEAYLFDTACEKVKEFDEFWKMNPSLKEFTKSILGVYNQTGIHACGVLILTDPVYHTFPCRYDKGKKMFITENDKDLCEELGGIKLDLLGLGCLEIIRDAVKMIKINHGKDFSTKGMLEKLVDLDDIKTLEPLARGDTTTLFQANTPVQTATYQDLKVEAKDLSVEDCSAINAIDRPGPMLEGFHHAFVRRKNGEEKVTYLHPSLEVYLKDTLGLLVYQEQVMQIVQDIGGFTPFEADKVRKAMGKKKMDLLASFEEKFLKGVEERGIMPKQTARELWGQMAKFAEYSFNRAHAFAYGCLTYLCGYFKAHYPLEWVCANFSRASRAGKTEDFKTYYKKWGQFVAAPDVNGSGYDYDIKDGKIYMPMFSIKGIGQPKAQAVADLRPFTDFSDFIIKLKVSGLEEKSLIEASILTGACDSFYPKMSEEVLKNMNPTQVKDHLIANRHALDISQEELDPILSKLDLGIALTSEELVKLCDDSTEGPSQKEIVLFRRKLLSHYFSKLRKLKVKNKLNDWIKENPELMNDKDLYKIYRLDDLRGTALDNPVLTLKGKPFNPIDYSKGSPLKEDYTNKEVEEATTLNERYDNLGLKHFILKELSYLGFTSYDFKELFSEEVSRHEERTQQKVVTPKEVIDVRDKVLENFNSTMEKVRELIIEEKSSSLYTKIAAAKEFIWPAIYLTLEIINNYQSESEVSSRIKGALNTLEQEEALSWLVALSLTEAKSKVTNSIVSSMKVVPGVTGLISGEMRRVLSQYSGIRSRDLDSNTIEAAKELNLKTEKLRSVFMAFLAINGGKSGVDAVDTLMPKHLDEYVGVFRGLKIDKNNYKSYQEALNEFPQLNDLAKSLNQDWSTKVQVKSFKELLNFLDRDLLNNEFLGKEFYIFASLFRPEKKKDFVKEYGKAIPPKRLARFSLTNEDYSINSIIFDIDSAKTWDDGKEILVTEKIIDFAPAIVRGSVTFDPMRNFEITFRPAGNPARTISFLIDQT